MAMLSDFGAVRSLVPAAERWKQWMSCTLLLPGCPLPRLWMQLLQSNSTREREGERRRRRSGWYLRSLAAAAAPLASRLRPVMGGPAPRHSVSPFAAGQPSERPDKRSSSGTEGGN